MQKPSNVTLTSLQQRLNCLRVLRWCGVWALATVWLTGCGGSLNQSTKNKVFSLNSALTSLSYELDLLDRQLLAANNVVQRNLEQLGGAANLTNDTALVEQASTVADDYQNKTVELRKLSERAHQLQAQYIELHEQYNQLVGDVENDDIGETDAEDQFAGYNRRFQTLKAEHDEIVPKLVEALNKHNALIDQYARNLRAYNLLMIEKTLRL